MFCLSFYLKRIETEVLTRFISQLSNEIDSKDNHNKYDTKINDFDDSTSNSSDNFDPKNISNRVILKIFLIN